MKPVTPKLQRFAHGLLALEAATRKSIDAETAAAFRVCERLRQPLSRLAGTAGFRSLLSRALALANNEVQWLKAIHVETDGSLEGFDEVEAKLSESEIRRGEAILVAQLIGLLLTFIGAPLTERLLQDIWPRVSVRDLNSATKKKP